MNVVKVQTYDATSVIEENTENTLQTYNLVICLSPGKQMKKTTTLILLLSTRPEQT